MRGAAISEDENGAGAGTAAAFDIGALIADEPGAGEIDIEIGGGLEDHAGGGLAAERWGIGKVGTEIGGVDQAGAQLAEELGLDGVILGFGKEAAGNAALVGDDEEAEAGGFEFSKGLGDTGIEFDLGGIAAIVDVFHEGAVAIEEDGGDERCGIRFNSI